jgi:hypothetical protein
MNGSPRAPSPTEIARAARAERRRSAWELAWSIAVLTGVLTIAVGAVATACAANRAADSIDTIHRLALGAGDNHGGK